MRTYFSSLTRPKHLADRLHQLLPALPLSRCQEWTAQVCGYRDWHDLSKVVKSAREKPANLSLAINADAALEHRVKKLIELLGPQYGFVVRIFGAWALDNPGAPKVRKLQLPEGLVIPSSAPIFALLREDLSASDRPPGSRTYAEVDNLIVTNGFADTDDKAALAEEFSAALPEEDVGSEELRMVVKLVLREHDFGTIALSMDGDAVYTQLYAVRVLGFEQRPRRLAGTVTLHVSLQAAAAGAHMLSIDVDDAALIEDEDGNVLQALSFGAAQACDNYVHRYAFSTIGNTDTSARIRLRVSNSNYRSGEVATSMLTLLKRNLRGEAVRGGMGSVMFEFAERADELDEIEA